MKAKQILNINNFDPLEVDISFIKEVTSEIPQEGYMDPAMAERLATITLRAAEKCDDLLGQAVLFLSHKDGQKRAVKSSVISALIAKKTPSTVVKELFADDPEFIEASNQYNIALAWHSWLSNKHGTLLKTHHWCKDYVRKTEGTLSSSNWSPTTDSTENLENSTHTTGQSGWNV